MAHVLSLWPTLAREERKPLQVVANRSGFKPAPVDATPRTSFPQKLLRKSIAISY